MTDHRDNPEFQPGDQLVVSIALERDGIGTELVRVVHYVAEPPEGAPPGSVVSNSASIAYPNLCHCEDCRAKVLPGALSGLSVFAASAAQALLAAARTLGAPAQGDEPVFLVDPKGHKVVN